MKFITVLSIATLASATNFTTYTDNNCKNVQTFEDGFANGGHIGCQKLPAGVQSLQADYRSFLSAYAGTKFYVSDDCSGPYVGQWGNDESTPAFPVPAALCIAAPLDQANATFGSAYFVTYR